MKQLEKNKLCYYCLGCNQLELEDFIPKMSCKNFMPAYKDWQEQYQKQIAIKGEKK